MAVSVTVEFLADIFLYKLVYGKYHWVVFIKNIMQPFFVSAVKTVLRLSFHWNQEASWCQLLSSLVGSGGGIAAYHNENLWCSQFGNE